MPVAVAGLPKATAVSVALRTACALATDGTVWCWGDNTQFQLGDGTQTTTATPIQVVGIQ